MNRKVIVTGASSGIGAATALALAHTGAELILVGRRAEALDEVAGRCGAMARAVVADLSEERGRDELWNLAAGDGLYPVLVNAAGACHFGDYGQMPWSRIEEQVRVNMVVAMALAHDFVAKYIGAGMPGGQIVNVLSIAATQPFSGSAAYCASKAGLLMFSRCLALEYRSQGLRVTSVIPGSTDTPLWEGKEWTPERRDMLSPEAVAQAIVDAILTPPDRNLDEIVIMPPKGVL